MDFGELKHPTEREEAFDILTELVPELNRDDFLASFDLELMKHHKLFGIRLEGALVSVAAAWVLTTGRMQKLLWIYAFVTTGPMRSKGCGRALVRGLEEFAGRNGFDEIRVHTHRDRALKFWKETAAFESFSQVLHKKVR